MARKSVFTTSTKGTGVKPGENIAGASIFTSKSANQIGVKPTAEVDKSAGLKAFALDGLAKVK